MRQESITLGIEEKFTPEEKAEIAGQLAIAVADLETISGEKKVSDAAFNERIKRCDAQITELAKRYNKGCETAQVGCDIRYDSPEVGQKQYVRMDTNEVVETHPMSWEEKQETIQFPLTESQPEAAPENGEAKLPCSHEMVSNIDGVWKCDQCGNDLNPDEEVIDEMLRITEVKPEEPPEEAATA